MPEDPNNTTVSFRLAEPFHSMLVTQAEASGLTKHQLARSLLIRVLTDQDRKDLLEVLSEISRNTSGLHLAIGRGVGAVLGYVSPLSQEAIRAFVHDRLIANPADVEGDET